jgi:hypothetical protein
MSPALSFSHHARERSVDRNVSEEEVRFIIQYGLRERQAGFIVYQLLRKSFPAHLPGNSPYRRLELTKVVLCKCGRFVITVVRAKEVVQRDLKKFYARQPQRHCPCCTQDLQLLIQ